MWCVVSENAPHVPSFWQRTSIHIHSSKILSFFLVLFPLSVVMLQVPCSSPSQPLSFSFSFFSDLVLPFALYFYILRRSAFLRRLYVLSRAVYLYLSSLRSLSLLWSALVPLFHMLSRGGHSQGNREDIQRTLSPFLPHSSIVPGATPLLKTHI